jgi:hypothetical protein
MDEEIEKGFEESEETIKEYNKKIASFAHSSEGAPGEIAHPVHNLIPNR